METNSYSRVKDYIFTNLKKNVSSRSDNRIKDEIDNAKKLIDKVGLNIFAQFLSDKNELNELTENDWLRMEREMEKHFNVKMKEGVLIQGEEQQRRDYTWWSNKEKIKGKNYYWKRYEAYVKQSLPPEVVTTIDNDTDLVMNNIGDPSLSDFDIKGMVVGHVQSGKTGNYAALVCKAADAGYKFIVVIAGGINNLRNQTQQRLNEAFVGRDKGVQVGAGIGDSPSDSLPVCLTTIERDFNNRDADKNSQSINFDNINTPILIVIKKHQGSLSNVIKWLKNQYKNKIANHSMLIIDDESDYASINTKETQDPTAINKNIRKLINLFSKGSYVAYTATPYANIFIDHQAVHNDLGDDLFPKDFIYALDAPSNYFGARKVFLDSDNKHLIEIKDEDFAFLPLNHKKDFIISYLPESLYEAIRLFLINISIRRLRGQTNHHNSLLIHISRFTSSHQQVAGFAEKYLNEIKKDVINWGKLKDAVTQSRHISDIKETLEVRLSERPSDETWELVLSGICDSINTIIVREVHQKTKIRLEYRDDIATNAIVIGGASLSRGFTLEGLSISYFLRTTVFYDTLMQMGRWFGYRTGYEDLCRVYMPDTLATNFAHIIHATEELIFNLKKMQEAKRTPNEFGLVVRQHPESLLQITARNKQKKASTFVSTMNLNGYLKETVRLSIKEDIRAKNLIAIKNIIEVMAEKDDNKGSFNGSGYLWREINKKHITKFLEDFETYQTDSLGAKNLMPIKHIQEYVSSVKTNWDVALYNGNSLNGKFEYSNIKIKAEIRTKFKMYENYLEVGQRKISSGSPEEIVLSEQIKNELKNKVFSEKGDKTYYVRNNMKNPLLMLHILDLDGFNNKVAAFGVCFPNKELSTSQTVTYTVNTVFESGLDDLLSNEAETDDE
jgi:Z1 domain